MGGGREGGGMDGGREGGGRNGRRWRGGRGWGVKEGMEGYRDGHFLMSFK